MTGAPVPAGADAIVMVEVTEGLEEGGSTGGTVAIHRAALGRETTSASRARTCASATPCCAPARSSTPRRSG